MCIQDGDRPGTTVADVHLRIVGTHAHAHGPRSLGHGERPGHAVRTGVDDIQNAGGFGGNEADRCIGQEVHAARSWWHVEMGHRFVGVRVEHQDVAAGLAGHEDVVAVRGYRDALRLLPDQEDVLHFRRGDVDDARRLHVFIGDVDLVAIRTEREFLRV